MEVAKKNIFYPLSKTLKRAEAVVKKGKITVKWEKGPNTYFARSSSIELKVTCSSMYDWVRLVRCLNPIGPPLVWLDFDDSAGRYNGQLVAKEVNMTDIQLLLIGGLLGFFTTLCLEFIKNRWEKRRNNDSSLREKKLSRRKDVHNFLSNSSEVAQDHVQSIVFPPHPAWLQVKAVINTPREFQIFRHLKTEEEKTSPVPPNLRRLWLLNQNLRKAIPSPADESPFERRNESTSTKFLSDNWEAIQELDNKSLKIQGTKFLLSGTNLIGRDDDCDIILRFDPAISRKHLFIRYENGRYMLHDLAPTNGCWINGFLTENSGLAILSPGDVIMIGDTLLEFKTVTTRGEESAPTVRPISQSEIDDDGPIISSDTNEM